ncbi:hypothetical protein AMECASPLE_029164 [Ameca splendens]|uniref:Uncharacterized protein n=1 Tax=Ameca splendens TaxID=208324 RepID=A0ABV1ACJ9_9TELE
MANEGSSGFSPFFSFFFFPFGFPLTFPSQDKRNVKQTVPLWVAFIFTWILLLLGDFFFLSTVGELIVVLLCNFLLMVSASSVCSHKSPLDNLTITASQSGWKCGRCSATCCDIAFPAFQNGTT